MRDEADGTYSVDYYFYRAGLYQVANHGVLHFRFFLFSFLFTLLGFAYRAGLYQVAIHGVGSESATSRQQFDSVDGVGGVYTYMHTQHVA